MINDSPSCGEIGSEEKEISLNKYSVDEIQLYFSDMKTRVGERFEKEADGELRFEVFAPRMEIRNYILQLEENLRLKKEDINGQRKIVASFQRMLKQSESRDDVFRDEVSVGNFRDISEAGRILYLNSLRGGDRMGLVLIPVKSSSGRILKERLDYLFEFFVDKQEFKNYVADLEAKVADTCVNYKCLQLFLEEMKVIENKIGG